MTSSAAAEEILIRLAMGGGDGEDEDDVTTHGDKSPDPGEQKYTDPRIGENADTDDVL